MEISAQAVKELRERTGAGILDCRKALQESEGSIDKAVEYLQKKSLATAAKKASRVAAEGMVGSYIHMGGKIGVLCEVNCETDFVAKTEDFQALVKDICMHIAAMSPLYLDASVIPAEEIEKQREIFAEQMKNSGKPDHIIANIVEGKLKKWYGDVCLLDQAFVKDPDQTIRAMLTAKVARIGENIQIRRFVRFGLGEGIEKKKDDFAAEVAAAAGI
ncbi:MAG: translation elongation factor Ts [Myxococcales bacterium]|nr:translation elongation factor Ts [Myxococcales bacterium]